jgi:hypothetical protein
VIGRRGDARGSLLERVTIDVVGAARHAHAAFACGPSTEKTEGDAVLSGVEKIRAVPSADTSARIRATDDLKAVKASTPEAKKARDACASGYRMLAESNALTAGALAEMKDTSTKSDPKSLVERMHRAEDLNEQAETELAKCSDAVATLASKPER